MKVFKRVWRVFNAVWIIKFDTTREKLVGLVLGVWVLERLFIFWSLGFIAFRCVGVLLASDAWSSLLLVQTYR